MAQAGLDLHRFVGTDHAAMAAQFAHLFGRGECGVELFGAGVEMQNALGALVVLQLGALAQLLQRVAAVAAEAHDLLDVVARAGGRAFAQKLQTPQPLAGVGAQAEQQRRIFLAQPFEQLERRTGVGPGLGVADGNLSAVGEAGLGARRILAIDDGHIVTQLLKEISGGGADDTGSDDDHAHDGQAFSKGLRRPHERALPSLTNGGGGIPPCQWKAKSSARRRGLAAAPPVLGT